MRKNRNLKKNYSANIYGLRSVFANRFGVYSSWHSRRNNASPFFFYSNRKSFAWYFIAPLKSQTFVWLFSTQLCNVTDQFLSFFLAQSVNVCYNSDNILGDLEYSLSNSSIILFFFRLFFCFFSIVPIVIDDYAHGQLKKINLTLDPSRSPEDISKLDFSIV